VAPSRGRRQSNDRSRPVFFQPLLDFRRFEAPRTGRARVGDLALGVDDHQPLGPSRVGRIHPIVGTVDDRGQRKLQRVQADLGDGAPLSERLGLLDLAEDPFAVDLCIDDRIGMGLADVDQEELGSVFVGLVDPL